jgi:hypothetical protein
MHQLSFVLARPGKKVAHCGESRKNGGSAQRRSPGMMHYTVRTSSCEQKIMVKNGACPAIGSVVCMRVHLAERQGPDRHNGAMENRGIPPGGQKSEAAKRGRDGQKARPCVISHDVCVCASALGCTTANKTRGKDRAVRFNTSDTTASIGVSAPVCSPTHARACVHMLDRKMRWFSHSGVCVRVHRFVQDKQSFGLVVACTGMCAPEANRSSAAHTETKE